MGDESRKNARAVGINHIGLEVDDVDDPDAMWTALSTKGVEVVGSRNNNFPTPGAIVLRSSDTRTFSSPRPRAC